MNDPVVVKGWFIVPVPALFSRYHRVASSVFFIYQNTTLPALLVRVLFIVPSCPFASAIQMRLRKNEKLKRKKRVWFFRNLLQMYRISCKFALLSGGFWHLSGMGWVLYHEVEPLRTRAVFAGRCEFFLPSHYLTCHRLICFMQDAFLHLVHFSIHLAIQRCIAT